MSYQGVGVASDPGCIEDNELFGSEGLIGFLRRQSLVLKKGIPRVIFWGFFITVLGFILSLWPDPDFHPVSRTDFISGITDTGREAMKKVRLQDLQCHEIAEHRIYNADHCMGPPFILMTFHGGRRKGESAALIHHVCKFSRDGCSLGSANLIPIDANQVPIVALRGLIIDGGELLVVESDRRRSAIRRYTKCNTKVDSRREAKKLLTVGTQNDPGLIHPYGIAVGRASTAIDGSGSKEIFVSTQGTYSVLRYKEDVYGLTLWPSSHWVSSMADRSEWGSMFKKFSSSEYNSKRITASMKQEINNVTFPNQFVKVEGEVRGITVDGLARIWVANKDLGIEIYDEDGNLLNRIAMNPTGMKLRPISLLYDESRESVIVGCSKTNKVHEFNAKSFAYIDSFGEDLNHPTGISHHEGILYVVSQHNAELVAINVENNQTTIVLRNLTDVGEFTALSEC